jgi:hypothetical protein
MSQLVQHVHGLMNPATLRLGRWIDLSQGFRNRATNPISAPLN